jgi:hypothetical protein
MPGRNARSVQGFDDRRRGGSNRPGPISVNPSKETPMLTIRRSVAALAIAGLALSACGGGDDAAAPADTDEITQAVGDATITIPAAVQEAVDQASADAGVSKDCQALMMTFGSVMASALVPGTPGADQIEAQLEAMKADLPDDLKSDVDTVATALAKMAEARKSDPNVDPSQFLDTDEVSAAGERLNNYIENECPQGG